MEVVYGLTKALYLLGCQCGSVWFTFPKEGFEI